MHACTVTGLSDCGENDFKDRNWPRVVLMEIEGTIYLPMFLFTTRVTKGVRLFLI